MTNYTFDEYIVSDLHKDAYGFRPDQSWWENWTSSTDDEKQKIWDVLIENLEASIAEENQMQAIAISNFEDRVQETIQLGAKDRETAIRWLLDASSANGDLEYFCYLNNLPYTYFKK